MKIEELSRASVISDHADPEHWPLMARYWRHIGSPLRPAKGDLEAYRRYASEVVETNATPRILLLGVTPEIYSLPWPKRRDFLAVDWTRAMIDYVWPGSSHEVLEANWLQLPLGESSRDVALCDGGLHLLKYPFEQEALVEQLHKVISPSGRCIFRLFALPAEREDQGNVLADLFLGQIPNLNVLKLRLGMALQISPREGVEVRKIWSLLRGQTDDWSELAARLGWSTDHLTAVDAYRDSNSRYHFISIDQASELFCRGGRFREVGRRYSSYVLGERCPVISFERQ